MAQPDENAAVVWQLAVEDPQRLADAVHAVATEDGERAAWLRKGAEETMTGGSRHAAGARRFRTVLELGYLAASADGLADAERASLARLLESITGAAVDRAALERHFVDLDRTIASLGRRERLARAAAEVDDPGSAEEAIALAALISMADGRLAGEELEILRELGGHLSVPAERVRALVDDLAGRVEARLR